jgi:hypothetical protein
MGYGPALPHEVVGASACLAFAIGGHVPDLVRMECSRARMAFIGPRGRRCAGISAAR